jgi:hypothetical protein
MRDYWGRGGCIPLWPPFRSSRLLATGTSVDAERLNQEHGGVPAANKQLERTVIRRRGRAASAPFHYAHAARWTRGHAAAQLRR